MPRVNPDLQIKYKTPWRPFKYGNEVPKKVLRRYFDWMEDPETEDGFFRFRNIWYHLSEFERTSVPGWDGAHADTFFSAVLLKVSSDGERYKAALALS